VHISALPTVTPLSFSSKAAQTRDGPADAQTFTPPHPPVIDDNFIGWWTSDESEGEWVTDESGSDDELASMTPAPPTASIQTAHTSALPTVTPLSFSSKAAQTRDGLADAQLIDAGCQCSIADWNSLYFIRDDEWSVVRSLGDICPALPIWPSGDDNYCPASESDDDSPTSSHTRPFFSKAVLSASASGKFSFGDRSRSLRNVGVHVCPTDWSDVVSPPPRMGVLLKQFRPGNCYDDDVDDDDDGDALAQEYEEYSYDPYDKD
jgi:hypothetical protein